MWYEDKGRVVPGRAVGIDCSAGEGVAKQNLGTGRCGTWARSGRLGRIMVLHLAIPWRKVLEL